jgi:hypothetical protein
MESKRMSIVANISGPKDFLVKIEGLLNREGYHTCRVGPGNLQVQEDFVEPPADQTKAPMKAATV